MASIKAQIDILLTGQRNVNNLLGQLNEVSAAVTEVETKWKVASAALQRTQIRLGVRGTQPPRGEKGRFTQDPDRQARLNALADRRAAVERLSRARAELTYETRNSILRGNAIRGQIEGNEKILRQTERRIALESELNTAVERLERRQRAYARGGGGSRLSEELQDRVRDIQTAFQAVGGANARNLSLVRSLATELGSIVELQNEVNRGTRLQSTGFYKAQGFERGIASLRERGVPASAFRTVGGQMRDYRSAVQRGNQPEAETVARRIKENLDRLGRDLDKSFAELRKSQSVRLAARSWQTFFEDAASQALQIKQSAQNTKESWQIFFKDAANQALAIKQAGQNTKQGWKNFFEDATNQALSIKQNGQETKQAWKSFFEDAANQALAIKQAGQDTKQSWKNFFEDATNQALAIKQSGQETKQSWQTFFEDAANSALQVKGASAETRASWQTFFEDAANQALAIKQSGQETKSAWKNFFEDAANQALAIKQNAEETKQAWKNFFEDAANQALAIKQSGQETRLAWKSFFEDAANQALAIKQNAQETRSAWKNFFEDAASQALSIKQNGQETKQAWRLFFEDAANQAFTIKQNAQETKNAWKSFFEEAASSALQIKQNNAEAKTSWRSFFEEASNQALSIKENAQKTKNSWKNFFEDATNQALSIRQGAQQAREAWRSFFEDAANQALAIKQGAAEAKNAWKLFLEDAANQALQIKENAKETKNSWQIFFEDAASEASRLRSPMLQARQNWQQFFEDAAKEAATARRKPIGAMTPEQRVATGVLDPASLRQTRLNRVARGRERREAIGRAGSEGLIGGAFPLLFGQGAGASAGGFAGGVAGGLAGGGLGFGLSLLGTVIGTAVDEADKLDKELTKVNASAKGVGNTSADVSKLASSLGIAKEEAVTLLAQFKQFGSAQIRKDLALVFGGGREAILERLESIVKEEDALQAIAAARKEIGNQEAISLLNTFKIQGSAQAQLVLRKALLRISEKERIEEKKRITIQDRLLAMFASGGDGNFVNPAIFGEERAREQQKIFDKERVQRRKNFDIAIKESQEFFKLIDELSGSGKNNFAADLLGAIDTRNEAIDNARKQREQQIADIRKQAIEAAARIEEDLADKRKRIEREIQDVRLNRADSAIDADIRFRELRGEDPGVIEAERELLAISREDRDARIELQRRLGDEESEQAKTIAEFQKGVAKQIQDANLASFRAIGEIQSNYAKQVAKIVEEGSTKGAKRLEAAAKLYSFYAERGGMNQARSVAGATIIPEPVMKNNQLDYQEVPRGVVTPRFRELDQKIYDLQKQLQSSRKLGIGQQFTALLGAEGGPSASFDASSISKISSEGGFEDVAGLKPLPLQKMLQQIGRPYTELYKQIQQQSKELYTYTRKEINKLLAPSPKRTEAVLKRAERVETVRQNWKPENAEWEERMNRWNPVPRSKPAGASPETYGAITRQLGDSAAERANKAGGGWVREYSSFLKPGETEVLRKGIQDQLRQGAHPLDVEYGSSTKIRQAVQGILEEQGLPEYKWSPRGPAPMFLRDENPLQDKRDPWVERFMQQTEPPQIIPGVQNRIEGASLFGTGFDISKIATDFGTIAAASILRGVLDDPEVSGASGSMQIAQAYNVKEGNRVGYYPPRPQKANAPAISGAAATTQARKDLAAETLAALDDKRFASLKNYFAEVNAEGLAVNKNLIEQNKLLNAQLLLMGSGVEAGLARQLVETENAYAARLKQLEKKRKDALKEDKGWDVSVVEGFYNAELKLLRKTNDEIKNRTTEYAKQSEFLLAIASLNQQIAVTGAAEEAGFFGAGANAYTSELARSGDSGQATEMAQQTRALEVKQAVAGIRGELNSLTDPMNQVIGAANAIGGAFSESFKGVISGSMSAKEALASFFRSTADYFLDMAAQIIQKWIVMTVLNQVVKLFPGGGGLSSLSAPATINNPLGDLGSIGGAYAKGGMFGDSVTPFANGGTFTNSIVSSPTLFRFADGGVTRMGEMGEAGPEAIMPLKRGPDGRLGVSGFGGGGGVSVVVNVDAKGSSVEGSDQGANQLGRVISAAVQSELIKQKRPGGILAR